MKANDKVKITKLTALPNAPVAAAKWDEYKLGSGDNVLSTPVDYEVEGVLAEDIVVGKCVEMLRTKRNGVEMPGLFTTSQVTFIDKEFFTTQNSKYRIVPI